MNESRKCSSIVYNAEGVPFKKYRVTKPKKSGPKFYWVLVDRLTTGKRRLLSHTTLEEAKDRADQIKQSRFEGRANRLALSNTEWQDVCIAREIV
jgi:hypothetical protein